MIVPTININGNTKESLLEEIRIAHNALTMARCALQNMTIHGRNFQTEPNGLELYSRSVDEQRDRIDRITGIMEELMEMYHMIDIQGGRVN